MTTKRRFTCRKVDQQRIDLFDAAMKHPNRVISDRAHVLWLLFGGLDPTLLGRFVGVSPHVVAGWQERFYAHGFDGLANAALRQLPAELPDSYRYRLDLLLKADPLDYGYTPHDGWNAERLSEELECATGIYLGTARLRQQLVAWGYTVGKRTIDRRSTAQRRFEAYFACITADRRLQSAIVETDPAFSIVTITTWRLKRRQAVPSRAR